MIISNLTSNLMQNLFGSLMGTNLILPIIDSSLVSHRMAFGDGFTKSDLMDVDGSDFVTKMISVNGTNADADQSTQTRKPQYIENRLNGFPAIKYDGVNDFMASSGSAAGIADGTEFTMFFVTKSLDTSSGGTYTNSLVSFTAGLGNDNFRISLTPLNSLSPDVMLLTTKSSGQGKVDRFSNEGGFYNVTTVITVVQSSGNPPDVYKNGSLLTWDFTPTNVDLVSIANYSIGTEYDNNIPTDFYNGDVGEDILYNRALSTDERQSVENYLSSKWGT